MIEAINTVVTDSELQYVSRSLFFLQLGERVEAACLLWRKQHAGIMDEASVIGKKNVNFF